MLFNPLKRNCVVYLIIFMAEADCHLCIQTLDKLRVLLFCHSDSSMGGTRATLYTQLVRARLFVCEIIRSNGSSVPVMASLKIYMYSGKTPIIATQADPIDKSV